MPIETHLQEHPGFLRVVFSGHLSRQDLQNWTLHVLRSPMLDDIRVVFVDLSMVESLDASNWVASHARTVSNRVRNGSALEGEVILAPDDHVFGYARMFQTYIAGRFQVEVCRTREQADVWLERLLSTPADSSSPVDADQPGHQPQDEGAGAKHQQ